MSELYPGSGGWRSSNVRDSTKISPDVPFLASEKYTVKRSGATFKRTAPGTGVNEVQTLAASGATAGTFTLTFGGQTTAALPFGATAAQVQTALQGLSSVGQGNVTVTGGPANTANLVITFVGQLGNQNTGLVSVDRTGLTSGGAAAVTETTRGVLAGVTEIRKGTFVIPDPANPGYYKAWAAGDTINDATNPVSGYLMESINVAQGDVTEGLLIQGSVLKARVQPNPTPAAIVTAITGRITLQ